MSETARYLRGASAMVAGSVVALMAGTGVAAASTSAHITSVSTSGTSGRPEITVRGSGFGHRPAANPANFPAGSSGCPDVPAAKAGKLYGTHLYFTDLRAKKGTYKEWTAGQYTPGSSGFYDCVGLVIDSWTTTKVRFHFGATYGKFFPGNAYFLSDGDRYKVFVQHASLVRTAHLG